ncbi:MAG: aminotransferase class IV [Tepidisphaeraceae bacterium]
MSFVWLSGEFVDESSAAISLLDGGLLNGAGVFTTMRADGGRVFRLQGHLDRLRDSCNALSIPLRHDDRTLTSAVPELIARNELSDARLRLTVTRGASAPDFDRGLMIEPTTFITAGKLEPYPREFYDHGLTVMLLDEQKLNPYDVQAGHKTLDYFSRLAALREANRRGAGEALWFNVHNYLQSGSISNVFLVERGKLITPPTQKEIQELGPERAVYSRSNVLPGITRGAVLDLARTDHISVEIGAITVDRLLGADEVFLTNSIMRVMPVVRIEKHVVGQTPGEVTGRLMRMYDEAIKT